MATVDYEALKFWLSAAQALLTAAVWLYVWVSNRNRVTTGRIETLQQMMDARLDGHSSRLAAVEAKLVTHRDIADLNAKMGEVAGAIAHVQGEVKTVVTQVHLINQHLMGGGR